MDYASFLAGGLVSALCLVAGLVMGHRMGRYMPPLPSVMKRPPPDDEGETIEDKRIRLYSPDARSFEDKE